MAAISLPAAITSSSHLPLPLLSSKYECPLHQVLFVNFHCSYSQ